MEIPIFDRTSLRGREWLELHENEELVYVMHTAGAREAERTKFLSVDEGIRRWPEDAATIRQALQDIRASRSK
jgi:hypothetical protein